MSITNNIQIRYKQANIVEKLIYINIAVFALTLLTTVFGNLFESPVNIIIQWFSLNSEFNFFITKPWTIVTYGFLHSGFLHILFNCLILHYFGRLFLDYFSEKQVL